MTGDRPTPELFFGGVIVPAELCAELAGALEVVAALQRGTAAPVACAQPRLTRGAAQVLQAAREAAVAHRRRETQRQAATAASAAPNAPLLPPAQTDAASGSTVTTAVAAGITGLSVERMRQLAKDGRIRGHQGDRLVWHLDLDSVRAYGTRSSRHGSTEDTDARREAR